MGLYRSLSGSLRRLEGGLEHKKICFSEQRAIRRKRPIFRDVRWSEEQKAQYTAFWRAHYGRDFPSDWHRLYESMNGRFDVQYFPEILYTAELERRLNPDNYCEVLSDKNLLDLLTAAVPQVRAPKTYFGCANGSFFTGTHELLSRAQMLTALRDIGDAVVKPTVDTGSGKGVEVVRIHDGVDEKSGRSLEALLAHCGRNFVIQERIQPCEQLRQLAPSCVSTIRLITYLAKDRVFHAQLVLRVGTGKSAVDNIHAGGLCIGVRDDGQLKKRAYRLGYGDRCEIFEAHPDSGLRFSEITLPKIPEMIEAAHRLHSRIPQLGIISWDFTVDREENVVLIEVNCKDQSVWFPQIVNEGALFGDNTADMLHLIAKEAKK